MMRAVLAALVVALADSVPDGSLTVVPGGHDIQSLHPDAVIDAVRSLLQ